MPRVIDGDNLLGTWPGRSRSDADKRALVREVDGLMRREKRRIVVVFDGTPPPGVSYGSDVFFSGQGRKADAVILDLLRRESDPRGWTVVTNDRSLADQSRFVPSASDFDAIRRAKSRNRPQTSITGWVSSAATTKARRARFPRRKARRA